MEPSWKTDPRLKGLDPAKLELLTRFSEDLKRSRPISFCLLFCL